MNTSVLAFVGMLTVGCAEVHERNDRALPDAIPLGSAIVEIGKKDELQRPTGAVRLANGNIAVVDAAAPALMFFDSQGRFVRAVGRAGGGPGEFRAPYWVAACDDGDELFVYDAGLARMTVLDTAGVVQRLFPTPNVTFLTCKAGHLAGLTLPDNVSRPDPQRERVRYQTSVQFFDRDGNVNAKSDTLPFYEQGPLAKVAAIAMARGKLWYSSGDSAHLEIYNLRGRRTRGVTIPVEKRTATDAHMAADIERIVAPAGDRATREDGRRMLSAFPLPEFMPPVRQLIVDSRNFLWVSTSFPGDSATELLVLDPDGKSIAKVVIPRLVELTDIGTDYIVALYQEDDIPLVGVFSLKPAELALRTPR